MKKVFFLEQFGFLEINGVDAQKFFQGYCTCNLSTLDDLHVAYGATCNLQGRMVTNFLVCRTESGLLLRLDKAMAEKLEDFLQKYIVFSKAKLNNVSNDLRCYGIISDEITANLEVAEIKQMDQDRLIRLPGSSRLEFWQQPAASSNEADVSTDLIRPLLDDRSDWLSAEINESYAWVNKDTTEEYLPQMFNLHQMNAIDFEKGCYLGQEIVARMHFRGKLKKTLHYAGAARSLALGEPVLDSSGKLIGEVIASAGEECLAVIQTKSATDKHYQLKDEMTLEATNLQISN